MDDMTRKKEYIAELARVLRRRNKTMSGPELAADLNRNGFRTTYGTRYKGGRGVYTLISATWDWETDKRGRDAIAEAFTDSKGNYAYDK